MGSHWGGVERQKGNKNRHCSAVRSVRPRRWLLSCAGRQWQQLSLFSDAGMAAKTVRGSVNPAFFWRKNSELVFSATQPLQDRREAAICNYHKWLFITQEFEGDRAEITFQRLDRWKCWGWNCNYQGPQSCGTSSGIICINSLPEAVPENNCALTVLLQEGRRLPRLRFWRKSLLTNLWVAEAL